MDERRTTMGLGHPPGSVDEEEGEQVRDEELMGGEGDPIQSDPAVRLSAPRISQRIPRLVPGASANEGDILVNRYRVEKVTARTSHEVVLEATHLDLGQRVILRHLSPLASTSPEAVARFQRGARKAREMRSEHAERVIDFGRLDSGAPYRAVELPRGPSLEEILRVRGALPVAEAVDIVLTACEPVAEAHASGIVHRSLGTGNVFVERRSDGTPLIRVLDFGVSDPLEPDWTNGDEQGVPGAGAKPDALRFAAPEQVRNPSAVDARVDVWALGAILYELLAGAPLFHADSALSLLAMIAADTPTPLAMLRPDVPPQLEQLVLSCLEKDPEARPRSVVDVVLALAPFASVEAQPAAARVARIVMRTTRPPPFPNGHAPRTTAVPSQIPAQERALVRSSPPPRPAEATVVRERRQDYRSVSLLVAGAAIGLASAVLAPRLVPQPAAPVAVANPVVTAVTAPAVPAAAVTSAPVVAPVAVAASTVASAHPVRTPAAAPQAVQNAAVATPQPPVRPQTPALAPAPAPRRAAEARAAERSAPADDSRAATRTAAASKTRPAPKGTASADDLFGGLD